MGPGPMDQENPGDGRSTMPAVELAAMGPGPMDQENPMTSVAVSPSCRLLQWGLALWTRRTTL